MPSPFPGMDPYLEAHWGDVHTSIATYSRNQLNRQLPPDLRASVVEHVEITDDEDGEGRDYFPDVRVEEAGHPATRRGPIPAGRSATEPLILSRQLGPRIKRSVHVREIDSAGRLVTVLEILSPSNKVGDRGRKAYLRKQDKVIAARVSLIEIDLLRTGSHVLAVPLERVPEARRRGYKVCVVRGWKPRKAELYAFGVRETLPVVRVPLRDTDADALLDLQAVMDQAYDDGSYETLDYHEDPHPPLGEADAGWADGLLRAAGKR